MAVEARHHHRSLFSPQILTNREFVANGNGVFEGNRSVFGLPVGYGMVGTTMATEIPVTMYGSAATTGALKSDSGLTSIVPSSSKRSRGEGNEYHQRSLVHQNQQYLNNRCTGGLVTFLGEDISFQIQQQQMEMDRYITQHSEKVRVEIESRRKKYSRTIAAAIEETVSKKLRAKDDEIEKLGKLNFVLEEKVKSLCLENQIWRDLAQTNEATANALRSNLEQLLAQIDDRRRNSDADDDDAQSCCGSNYNDDNETDRKKMNGERGRLCKSCDKEEACVLLLPCRHLCLCTLCGSAILTCPLCHSTKTATLHVNLS